jgi:FkbM family methyltransferase
MLSMLSLRNRIISIVRTIFLIFTPIARTLEAEAQRLQGKGYYPNIGREVNAILRKTGLKNNVPIVLFDVGANLGDYSHAFLKKNKNVEIHCFEPSPFAFQALTKDLPQKNVYHHNVALSDSSGTQQLFFDFAGSGWASLAKRDLSHTGVRFDNSEMVNVVTLDNWVSKTKIRPHLLKIDVEGFELQVLHGGRKSLKFVNVVQFEFGGTNIDSRHFFKDYWDFFELINFSLYRLTPLGLKKISRYSEELECFKFSNYYAVNNNR